MYHSFIRILILHFFQDEEFFETDATSQQDISDDESSRASLDSLSISYSAKGAQLDIGQKRVDAMPNRASSPNLSGGESG